MDKQSGYSLSHKDLFTKTERGLKPWYKELSYISLASESEEIPSRQ